MDEKAPYMPGPFCISANNLPWLHHTRLQAARGAPQGIVSLSGVVPAPLAGRVKDKDDMRRLRNHLIGIEQGKEILFSDFADHGEMWTGNGPRERVTAIAFSQPFRTLPVVHVSLDMWDMDQKTNQRADISARNVTLEGFEIVFRTWGDTRVARVRAAWLAIGELRDDDEWELS